MFIGSGFLRELIPRTMILTGSSGNVRFRAVRQSRSDAPEKLFLNFAIPLIGGRFRCALLLKIVIERPTGGDHGLG
jgi:hypothetical protein